MSTGVEAKLLKSTKFPPEYSKKVDMQKVNLEVMKQWIAQKVVEILGSEDDVVIDYIFGMLEGERNPDPKKLQLNLTGFLEKDTPAFCKQLWNLLLSAQGSAQGIPSELLEAKKEELRQQKLEAERAAEQQRRRREQDDKKEHDIVAIRQRERGERNERSERGERGERSERDDRRRRGPPPGRDAYRSHRSPSPVERYRRSPDHYRGRQEYTPPPRGSRRGDRFDRGGRRETDTYIPSRRGSYRRDFDDREGRGYRYGRSRSRTRSPPRSARRDDHYRRRSPVSRSPQYRRGRRGRSHSRSATPPRRRRADSDDHKGRRTGSPSSYSESSSSRSRSYSSSAYESSRSGSRSPPRKSRRDRSVSSERGGGADRRRRRSPSATTRSHADEGKARRSDRSRSLSSPGAGSRRRRHSGDEDYNHDGRDRDRSTPPRSKRHRSRSSSSEDGGREGASKVSKTEGSAKREPVDLKRRESELREQLLKEKIKRSRKNSGSGAANEA